MSFERLGGGGGGGQGGQLSLRQFILFVFFVLTGSTLQTGTGLRDSFRLSWTLRSWKGRLPSVVMVMFVRGQCFGSECVRPEQTLALLGSSALWNPYREHAQLCVCVCVCVCV